MATQPITLTDPQTLLSPREAYRALRDHDPVYLDPVSGIYVITRYEDIRRIASDPETFSNMTQQLGGRNLAESDAARQLVEEEGWATVNTLVTNDPPSHRKYRLLVEHVFQRPRIRSIEPQIEAIASELIDGFASSTQVEFMSALAIPLPLTVIADQLGVPRERSADFKLWSDSTLGGADFRVSPEKRLEFARDIVEMQKFFAERIEEAREAPTETLLSDLVHVDVDGVSLTMAELLSLLQQLLVAGNETTTNALGSAMVRLTQDQQLQERLRKNPRLIAGFVEETLRLDAPLQRLFREAKRDVEIGGVSIPKGATLQLVWGSGNLDERRYEAPEEIRLDREHIRQHLTFGFGIHYCVGHLLARAELNIAYRLILQRMKNIRLADTDDAVVVEPHFIAQGPKRVEINFDPIR